MKEWTLDAVNKRLKDGNMGIVVYLRGNRLSLRATFPSKPGVDKGDHQQYFIVGIYANPAGFQRAEEEARYISGLLATNRFDWNDYLDLKTDHGTCAYWIEKFKIEYFAIRGDDLTKRQTWEDHYQRFFKRLPEDQQLTNELLVGVAIATTTANTWARRTICQKFSQLAKFVGIACDLKKYQGNYSPNKQAIKQLPSKEEIIIARDKIINSVWCWIFSVIATYGVRPHETIYCEISEVEPYVCEVLRGKTGNRLAFPLPLEWAVDWQLWNKTLPDIKIEGCTQKDLGSKINKSLAYYNLGFSPYDLRHAWALRAAVEYQIPTATAAKWMGHSPAIHLAEYQRHVTSDDSLRIYREFTK